MKYLLCAVATIIIMIVMTKITVFMLELLDKFIDWLDRKRNSK